MEKLKDVFTPKLKSLLEDFDSNVSNPIFVFIGMEQYVDLDAFKDYILDLDTFNEYKNGTLFNQVWGGTMLGKLMMVLADPSKPYTILSLPQYGYLLTFVNEDLLKNRIVLVSDGIRRMLPLDKALFISEEEGKDEERPEQMPVYMADYFRVGDKCFFSYQIVDSEKIINLLDGEDNFQKAIEGEEAQEIDDAPYAIDEITNGFLSNPIANRTAFAVSSNRLSALSDEDKKRLYRLNELLLIFGAGIALTKNEKVETGFEPQSETIALLKKYWGEDAQFRSFRIYEDPDLNKDIIAISQAQIVETLIEECNNAREGKGYRDLFLTAPTGAGKSLLFQLPAFDVSSHGDVSIVVSPLIALMDDQVDQIFNERGFTKVAYLNSDLALADRDRVIDRCKAGEIDVLYMAPELLLSYDLHWFLGERKLGLLVIDEAHLITTWGREFRVDYWYLGQHVNKIRKSGEFRFPIIAVTATAVYGGDNDMVNDSIRTLFLHMPHKYIGEVKRNDISFVINNHEEFSGRFDTAKEKETVDFIKKINEKGIRTLVYAPYRTHINAIEAQMGKVGSDSLTAFYHAGRGSDARVYAIDQFRAHKVNTMVSTKAFGMGIDIQDIQVVYHHAPSGTLADYIQEVGRVARKEGLHGYAAISYTPKELRYTRQLHGISALRNWQLREVLKKLYSTFESNGKHRNFLVSSDDFGYIFNSDNLDQKVMTSLMMLEKDYLASKGFNVLIARRKKLFAKVYARTTDGGFRELQRRYQNLVEKVSSRGANVIITLDLDGVWQKDFSEESFPQIKRKFFIEKLFSEDRIELSPQVKMTFNFKRGWKKAYEVFDAFCDSLSRSLSEFGGSYFTDDDFREEVMTFVEDSEKAKRITKYFLDAFSDRPYGRRNVDAEPLLQRRNNGENISVKGSISGAFSSMKRCFSNLFESKPEDATDAVTFKKFDSVFLDVAIKLASLLELLDLAEYEYRGGDNPMIFIRLNDPYTIKKDANFANYSNSVIRKQERHHKTSCKIFNHFFTNLMTDEDRWNFIEDFFLGESEEELLERYPESTKNHVDIVDYISTRCAEIKEADDSSVERKSALSTFPPVEKGNYSAERLLTIDGITKKIKEWLTADPVSLDRVRRKFDFRIPKDIYKVLMSKLVKHHYPYFRDSRRLKVYIYDYPGQTGPVLSSFVYQQDPVKFYRWWKTHREVVTMNSSEFRSLLEKVNRSNPRLLTKADRVFLLGKK